MRKSFNKFLLFEKNGPLMVGYFSINFQEIKKDSFMEKKLKSEEKKRETIFLKALSVTFLIDQFHTAFIAFSRFVFAIYLI